MIDQEFEDFLLICDQYYRIGHEKALYGLITINKRFYQSKGTILWP